MQADRPFWIRIALYAIFIALLAYIQYFILRFESTNLILAYSALFLIYLFLLKCDITNWKEIFIVAIITRLALFFDIPNLSDDFYRFIWDGNLLSAGVNPFTNIPEYYMSSNSKILGLTSELYEELNSKNYFTIYPPISQFIFWLSVKFNLTGTLLGSVTIMRSIIVIFEIGTLIVIKRLLTFHNLPKERVLIYAMNPLVILELTGNLHFEAILIFFILLSIYLFNIKKTHLSALAMAASIVTKLVPLMLLPVYIKKHKNWFKYYLIIGISIYLFFLPIFNSTFIQGISGSLALFFKSFEFNGGLFFLIREIGMFTHGYDLISYIGPLMSLIALLIILSISFFSVQKNTQLESIFIIIIFVQLLFATTVHPWYVIPMIALCCMTKFTFPIVWSFFIFLTYVGYSASGFEHPFGVIILEYLVVGTIAFFEIKKYLSKQTISDA